MKNPIENERIELLGLMEKSINPQILKDIEYISSLDESKNNKRCRISKKGTDHYKNNEEKS